MQIERASPELVYADFGKAAHGAARNVREFAALTRDPQSQEVQTRVQQSEEQSRDGIEGWLVSQHPNWLQKPTVTEMKPKPEPDESDQTGKPVGEGVQEDVEGFTKAHSDVAVKLDMNNKAIDVSIVLWSIKRQYAESLHRSDSLGKRNPPSSWAGETKRNPTSLSIPSPARRPPSCSPPSSKSSSRDHTPTICCGLSYSSPATLPCHDADHLQEMLASYHDVQTKKCEKCNRLLDYKNQWPVVRERRPAKPDTKPPSTRHAALHLGCRAALAQS